ncbi:MAG: glycoside hydrolase [Polaribacter sp.]|nr:glycoside hydrolase [Polaribacter sp.]
MKTCRLLILLALFLQIPIQNFAQKINGISFVASKDSISIKHVQPILKMHSNFVALMPFGFVKGLETPEVRYNSNRQWFGETKKGLKHYATAFQKNKVKIMVKPQIWVWRGQYTGFIKMKTEDAWKILEKSYEKFILDYAGIAAEIQADILCIGTELEKFIANRPIYWIQLIAKIRNIYKGKLTYASNWDEFKRVPFWDKLDYIGVDAYFPLSEQKTPSVSELEKGWESHKNEIQRIQQQFQKPILFTEFGYRSINFTAKEPWSSAHVQGNVNLKAQANATQAIFNQFWKEDWFAGGFLWKWFHNVEKSGGEKNNRFTPQNKPAGKLIQQLYTQ